MYEVLQRTYVRETRKRQVDADLPSLRKRERTPKKPVYLGIVRERIHTARVSAEHVFAAARYEIPHEDATWKMRKAAKNTAKTIRGTVI